MKFFAPFRISENISETPEGYLLCRNVAIGRAGEMVYGVGETPLAPGPDGKVYVTRSAEELFRPETIASFEGKSLTILHPDDHVNPNNWSELTKGTVQNVRRGTGEQENDLVADFLVTVADAIELVKNGLREVSCGYEAEYTQTGVGRGFQTKIFGNHVALVDQGRAGAKYAINDHKGEGSKMTLKQKIQSIFAKAQDEAMTAAGCKDEGAPGTPETKEGFVTMKDMQGYMDAAFKKMTDSFGEMLKGKKEGSDAITPPDTATGKPAEVEAEDEPQGGDIAAVLKRIEERLSKLESSEEEETGDEEGEEGEESEDEAEEESSETGDSATEEDEDEEDLDVAARVEILAPGMDAAQKNVKVKAVLAAYGTKDGKSVIDTFTGGKAPNAKDAAKIDAIFIGASEVLKTKRSQQVADSRGRARDSFLSTLSTPKGAKSAEEINEMNAKYYGGKKD